MKTKTTALNPEPQSYQTKLIFQTKLILIWAHQLNPESHNDDAKVTLLN